MLPYPQHRLCFLDLQLELLDDFRIRLLQVRAQENQGPLGQCYCAILNSASYVSEILSEWSELLVGGSRGRMGDNRGLRNSASYSSKILMFLELLAGDNSKIG